LRPFQQRKSLRQNDVQTVVSLFGQEFPSSLNVLSQHGHLILDILHPQSGILLKLLKEHWPHGFGLPSDKLLGQFAEFLLPAAILQLLETIAVALLRSGEFSLECCFRSPLKQSPNLSLLVLQTPLQATPVLEPVTSNGPNPIVSAFD
jgi:hypothetical protein